MNRSRSTAVVAVAFAISLVFGIGSPANARWIIHNSNDVTEMTSPPGGTEDQTCPDRLRGATGWSTFVDSDPPVFEPPPPEAFTSVNYEVWKAPAGFTDFGEAQEVLDGNGEVIGYNFFDPVTFDPVPATFVKFFTTAARTELPEPIAVNGGSPSGDVYVFTSAPIDEPLPGAVVGDVLGLKPTGGSTFISLAVVGCDYHVGGFVAPVDDPPTVNVGQAGSSYKVRFQLRDPLGDIVDSLSAV